MSKKLETGTECVTGKNRRSEVEDMKELLEVQKVKQIGGRRMGMLWRWRCTKRVSTTSGD
jgi:hypothetical protein